MGWLLAGGACLCAAGFALDQLLLAFERRGWVYWRRSRPGRGSAAGNALFTLHTFVEPTVEHVQRAHEEQAGPEEHDPRGDGR